MVSSLNGLSLEDSVLDSLVDCQRSETHKGCLTRREALVAEVEAEISAELTRAETELPV